MSWNHYDDEYVADHPDRDPVGRVARLLTSLVSVLRPLVDATHKINGVAAPFTASAVASLDEIEWQLEGLIETAPHYADRTRRWYSDDRPVGERLRAQVADMVGGPEALASLDTIPLPDEQLALPDLADDLRERIATIAEMCDACNEALFDVEHRTATRRLIARVARHGPRAFRSKSKDERLAAALCWVVAASNESLQPTGPVATRDLLDHFGVKSSVSHNAATLLEPAGLAIRYGTPRLVWPRYLVSARRREIIDLRDEMTATA